MIGPLLLLITWLLLRAQRRPLCELGFNKPGQRATEFSAGFCLAAAFAALQFLLTAYFADIRWQLNASLDSAMVVASLRWNVNSVLFEELVFRGYLLYKAIELLGRRNACLLSAACFGVYHWFSYGAFGAVIPMLYTLVLTGAFGLMLAWAFARSGSVALPVGLHLGWNYVSIFVFSNGPLGPQLLVADSVASQSLGTVEQLTVSVGLPLGFVLLVTWLLHARIGRYAQPTLPAPPSR